MTSTEAAAAGAVRTTCPYCGVGCGVLATPTASDGDPAHPANRGRLCGKGMALHETLGQETRLLHPRVDGVRASWDTALDRVADAFRATIARHGPDSVALYVSGQLLTEDYYAANKLAKGFLGTANIDSNSRLCMSSAVAGHVRAFGQDVVPVGYDDLCSAGLAVLAGSNTAWCHPVLFQRMVAAGVPYVVIDPRRTPTCEGAALHLPLRPGSDVALWNGLLAHLARTVACDLTIPGAVAAVAAAQATVAETAAACDLDPADVAAFFDLFARTQRVVTLFSQGVNQSSSGTDKVNAITNVHLLTGRVGHGAGPFSITGQPNAMGGREVGALSNLLAGHLSFDHAPDLDALRAFWGAPSLVTQPGRKAVDLFRAIGSGQVRAVWIMGTNPAVSLPDSSAVRAALAACPFVAVSDCADGTDTLAHAHVALPALAWGERDGTVTNSERVISRQRPFLPPAGEARADWRIVAGVAARLGFGAAFAWTGAHDVFDEHARLTGLATGRRRVFDISGLAGMGRAAYDAMDPVRWPVPVQAQAGDVFAAGYPTADGRPRLIPLQHRAPANAVSDAYPWRLSTGRLRDQWHTMTRTGLSPRLMRHRPEPFVAVHPDAAGGLADGTLAVVRTAHGAATLRVRHDAGMRPGELFVPMHWTDRFAPAGRVNAAVNAEVDPISGQPEFKHTPAALAPFPATWFGAVLARRALDLDWAEWRACWPMADGVWRCELAGTDIGMDAPAAVFARLRAAAEGAGAWSVLRDPGAGAFSAVRLCHGALQAAATLAPGPGESDRDWLASRFAVPALSPGDRRALLAGRSATGGLASPAICICHGVSRAEILEACATGCADVATVGAATKAGTGCGSCRPEIAALLRTTRAQVAAVPQAAA